MNVIDQAIPSPTPIPGVSHATWAGHGDGSGQLSVWRQTLAPGAATPPHRHDCDEVVLCLGGQGAVHEDGQVRHFSLGQTVILPGGRVHQLFNTGAGPLALVAVFAATPVGTCLPDGEALELPWRS